MNHPAEVNHRVLQALGSDFHPTLRSVQTLANHDRMAPRPTRTGIAHPILPILEDPSSSSSESPPTPLRTTREGIRLEITPISMVRASNPEVAPVIARDNQVQPPPHPDLDNPETNPEA